MNIYFDTEFTGLHKKTTLVSIGVVADNGNTFYAELNDYDGNQVDEWLEENVISKLKYSEYMGILEKSTDSSMSMKGPSHIVAKCLSDWVEKLGSDQVTIVSDCMHYDMVLLIDLLTLGGSALDMDGDKFYYIPVDLSSLFFAKGIDPDINREEYAGMEAGDKDKHNALWDALVIKECYNRCMKSI
jgi:oligoribonuclease (3'-5' exoribonuclease)